MFHEKLYLRAPSIFNSYPQSRNWEGFSMSYLKQTDGAVYELLQKETEYQQKTLRLIASENYASRAVMEATGSVLTNKYAEGYPKKRYYAGNQYVDEIELLAIERAK